VTPFQRHLAITVVLAGLAGFVGVWVGTQHMGGGARPTPPLRAAVDELTHRGLVGLTAEQKQRIDDIQARYVHTRTELRARIAAANVELANALAEEMSFGPLAQQSIQHLQDNVGELQKQTVLYVLELRSVLTPQQRVVFDEKVVAALMTEPR
jgi:hypothetical protein